MKYFTNFVFSAILVFFSISQIVVYAGEINPRAMLALPPLAKAPIIDGGLKDSAWAGATLIQGFNDPRRGETRVGYDSEFIYLAICTELPPSGNLLTRVRRDDDRVFSDDSIEIWIDPNWANFQRQEGDQRFYQIIINHAGAKLDVQHETNKVENLGWDLKGHFFADKINTADGTWDVEFALPWSAFGIKPDEVNVREIGLLIVRNWKSPIVQAKYSLASAGMFADRQAYPLFHLQAGAPIIQEKSLGAIYDPSNFAMDYQLAITNTSSDPTAYHAEAAVESSDMPRKDFKQDFSLSSKGGETFRVATIPGTFHRDSVNTFTAQVTSLDKKAIYFRRNLVVGKPSGQVWMNETKGEENTGVYIAYYPSTNRLSLLIDSTATEKSVPGSAAIEIRDGEKILLAESLAIINRKAEKILTLPALPDGTYTVRVTMKTAEGNLKPIDKIFIRKHFPWENNTLGVTETVYPPFLPVKVDGQNVDVVLRRYRMNGFGLWDSVISQGKELLAAPIAISGESDQGALVWQGKSGRFVESRDNKAVFEGVAESGSLIVKTRSTIEEDGCMKTEMTLVPEKSPVMIKRLCIDIPVKDEFAPLWHAVASGQMRSNPAGLTPKGQGVVWESRQTGNGAMLGTIIPYLWIGGAERGISWFADNDKNWVLDDQDSAQTLIRENGCLRLRLNLISRPLELCESRTIIFGLQATPAKPMPQDWRNFSQKYPRMRDVIGGAGIYWGMLQDFSAKYPAQHDFSIADQLLATRNTGKINNNFITDWMREKVPVDPELQKVVGSSIGCTFNWMTGIGNNPQFIYYEEHFQDQASDEWKVFQDEWGTEAYTSRIWKNRVLSKNDMRIGVRIHTPQSYVDFALWYAKEWMRRGFSLYCDNLFPANCFNPLTSDAYVRADGKTQASANLWELREYYKRLWKLEQQCRPLTPYPLLKSFHMTNANLIPVLAWGEINMDIEWSGVQGPFAWDFLLAETIGLQAGNYPFAYHQIGPRATLFAPDGKLNDMQKTLMERTEWSMRFIHEIMRDDSKGLGLLARKFGYGTPDCEVLNYWNDADRTADQPHIAVSDEQIKWIALWKPKERLLLLTLVNWKNEPRQSAIKIVPPDGVALNQWKDAETGKDVETGKITLQGWGTRLINVSSHSKN